MKQWTEFWNEVMAFKWEEFGEEYFEITGDNEVSDKILTLVQMTQRKKMCFFSQLT